MSLFESKQIGVFRGRELVQTNGKIGGSRHVFVKLQGVKNELVYPTIGGQIMNPFKGSAKFYAGDLFEYRTNANGAKPELYLLKTYEVVSHSTTTINIARDGYRHKPFVGDILMVAPDFVGGTNRAVKVTNVVETTVTISSTTYNVWTVTTSANIIASGSIAAGTVLVEGENFANAGSTNENVAMMVKNINGVADCDGDMFEAGGSDFNEARYFYTPALGGLMYTSKMSVMPACVHRCNKSNVNGWFKVENCADVPAVVSAAAAPTTSTVGYVGQFLVNTANGDVYVCVTATATTYTWKKITLAS